MVRPVNSDWPTKNTKPKYDQTKTYVHVHATRIRFLFFRCLIIPTSPRDQTAAERQQLPPINTRSRTEISCRCHNRRGHREHLASAPDGWGPGRLVHAGRCLLQHPAGQKCGGISARPATLVHGELSFRDERAGLRPRDRGSLRGGLPVHGRRHRSLSGEQVLFHPRDRHRHWEHHASHAEWFGPE